MATRIYIRKDGTVVRTSPIRNPVLNKKGLLKLVEVIPPDSVVYTKEIAESCVRIFGPEIRQALFKASKRKPSDESA